MQLAQVIGNYKQPGMMKREPLILLLVMILITVSCGKSRKIEIEVSDNPMMLAEYAHYEIDLSIDPKTQDIIVQGYFKPGTTDSSAGTVFYLDKNMEIQYFGQKKLPFTWLTFLVHHMLRQTGNPFPENTS